MALIDKIKSEIKTEMFNKKLIKYVDYSDVNCIKFEMDCFRTETSDYISCHLNVPSKYKDLERKKLYKLIANLIEEIVSKYVLYIPKLLLEINRIGV